MPSKRALSVIVLGLLVVTAGCSGAGGAGGGGDGVARSGGAGGGDAAVEHELQATAAPSDTAARSGDGGDGGGEALRIQSRSVIRTGEVSLEVDDFGAARRNLTGAAERYGGFVSDSSERLHRIDNRTYTTGVIVLRVPRDNFSALLNRVEAGGTVLRSDTSSRDVTDQLVDIEARLGNLRSQREQLRALYARANDTEDVLAVQRELSGVQERIERLEARQQSLERRVAFSTIRVELAEPRPEPEPEPVERWYDIGVVAAFLDSVNGVVVALRAAVVAVAYALPYLLVFGVPMFGAVVAWRYRDEWRRGGRRGGR